MQSLIKLGTDNTMVKSKTTQGQATLQNTTQKTEHNEPNKIRVN